MGSNVCLETLRHMLRSAMQSADPARVVDAPGVGYEKDEYARERALQAFGISAAEIVAGERHRPR